MTAGGGGSGLPRRFQLRMACGSRLNNMLQRVIAPSKIRNKYFAIFVGVVIFLRAGEVALGDRGGRCDRSAEPLQGIVFDQKWERTVDAEFPLSQTTKEPFEQARSGEPGESFPCWRAVANHLMWDVSAEDRQFGKAAVIGADERGGASQQPEVDKSVFDGGGIAAIVGRRGRLHEPVAIPRRKSPAHLAVARGARHLLVGA